MPVIEDYLQAKYGGGGPSSGRFEPTPGEVHSSRISNCQRAYYWKFKQDHKAEASPYFELGNIFEMMYGAALAHAHDDTIDSRTLNKYHPWQIAQKSKFIQQDVNVKIELKGDNVIVGECDWVVLEIPVKSGLDRVELSVDGERTMVNGEGDRIPYDGEVKKVVETKTKKDISWPKVDGPDKKHVYQVYPYMKALDAPGEIVYMQRNDWDEYVVPLDFDDNMWLDAKIRALTHASNVRGDELPPATPLSEGECKWCDFRDECAQNGGSEWL